MVTPPVSTTAMTSSRPRHLRVVGSSPPSTPVAAPHRHPVADRLCTPGTRPHLITAVATSLVLSAVAVTAMMIVLGEIITHIGPLERWDDRAATWFVERRTPTWTTVSYWGTFIANTLGV